MFKRRAALIVLGTMLSTVVYAMGNDLEETRSTLNDQQTVAVTIYNSDLALIKDTRKVKLKPGLNALALRDVSAQIRPETGSRRPSARSRGASAVELGAGAAFPAMRRCARRSAWLRPATRRAEP